MVSSRHSISLGCLVIFPAAIRAVEANHQGGTATVRSGQILGQPWEEKSGQWRGGLFGSYLSSSSTFDANGGHAPLTDNGRFTNWGINLFGEYVMTGRWSVSAFLPLQRSTFENNLKRDTWASRGDVYGWARYGFDDFKGFSPALVLGAKVPGNYQVVSGFGDGQMDYELQGFMTKNMKNGQYFSVNSGYRYRLGSVADEILFGGQFGVAIKPGWMVIPPMNGVKGIGTGIQMDYLNAGFTTQNHHRFMEPPGALQQDPFRKKHRRRRGVVDRRQLQVAPNAHPTMGQPTRTRLAPSWRTLPMPKNRFKRSSDSFRKSCRPASNPTPPWRNQPQTPNPYGGFPHVRPQE